MQKFIAELSDWDTSIDGESAAGKTSVQHSGRDAYALDTRHREPLVACRAATARSSG